MQKKSTKSVDERVQSKGFVSSLTQAASRAHHFVLAPIAVAALMSSMSANALTIIPTYDITSVIAYDDTAKATVASAISFYETTFTDPMTVYINFKNSGTGLGGSSQVFYNVGYDSFMTALRGDSTSADDATAMLGVPTGVNPVNPSSQVWLTRANAAAVGLTVGSIPGPGEYDADIDLNLGLMNFTHGVVDNGNNYDLKSVAMHEINEVLGLVSGLPSGGGNIGPVDLFRYTSAGVRTFITTGDDAYFKLNSTTQLARYNMDSNGDLGDFWSNAGPHPYQIQDAFSSPGLYAEMGAETRMLDAVGYTLAVPEPETYALMLAGLGFVGWAAKRRKA